jgi:hypothetical protein
MSEQGGADVLVERCDALPLAEVVLSVVASLNPRREQVFGAAAPVDGKSGLVHRRLKPQQQLRKASQTARGFNDQDRGFFHPP